jgi:Zn-dependent protease
MSTRPPVFYAINSSAVTLREYWWGTKSPAILAAALLKLLRVKVPSATDDPNVESLEPFEVEAASVPERVTAHLEPLMHELEGLGFGSPMFHVIEDDLHHVQTYLATFVHSSGRVWARVHNRVWAVKTPPKDVLFVEFVTPFSDGRFLWSLSSKPDLAAPPSCSVVRQTGASATELLAAHDAQLHDEGRRHSLVPVRSPAELRASIERHHGAVRNFHLRRGVFVRASAAERQTAAANAAVRKAAESTGTRFPEVVAAIRRLEERKSSWTTAILVLLVSVGLFVGAGGVGERWSLDTLAILMPVLFFHEMGHWLAMKAFGYRNLQMFFIPFLGAAVSGRHYNVPGWKKAVVSLMGPLPGIVVGAALGVAGLVLKNPLLLKISLTALVLNGFNLLPVLPLDGGWVVQSVLASRSVAFGVLFRVVAIAALFGFGLQSGDKTLTYLGIFMLVGLPAAYRLARITRDLRRAGLEPVSPDDQTIPAETAEAIIEKVVEAFPKRTPTNVLAQHTLSVFESLNARAPGVVASFGLAVVQGGGLATAVVFGVLVVIGQHSSLAGFAQAAAAMPTHTVDPSSLAVWREPEAASDGAAARRAVVIATWPTASAAAGAALELQRSGPARSAVETFGDTLLVALPGGDDAARQAWLAALQPRASDVLVATTATPANVRLACLAPSADVATAIEQEASAYFAAKQMNLIPPWIGTDPRTPAERSAHDRARRTYARLVRTSMEGFADPRFLDVVKRTAAARKAGDAAALERLRHEQEQVMADVRRARASTVRAEPDADATVVARYEAWVPTQTEDGAAERLSADLGPLLGQMPPAGATSDAKASALGATGFASREGLLVSLPFVRFDDMFEGPPAILRWLQSKGCVDFRYQFDVAAAEDDEAADAAAQ